MNTTPTTTETARDINLQINSQQVAAVDGLPFEIKCIETILTTIIRVHRIEFEALEVNCMAYLSALHGSSLLSTDQQELLRELKEGVSDTMQRVQNCSKMLSDLLADDVAMTFTMLSQLAKTPEHYTRFKYVK
jgi:prophage DNA circulation protein